MKLKYFCSFLLVLLSGLVKGHNFSTEGNGIRNVIRATVKGESVLYISELEGTISCYSITGEKLWENHTNESALLFEMEAADLNNDKNEDVVAASGDGHVYCWDSSGELLWSFAPTIKMQFTEVAVLQQNNATTILAGGNDSKIYELNSEGNLISTTPCSGIIRKIEVGNFNDSTEPSIFLMTYSHDKFRWQFMGFLDANSKKPIHTLDFRKAPSKDLTSMMMTDINVSDIDKNGKDDILIFGDNTRAVFFALNGEFEIVSSFIGNKKDKQRYAHAIGTSLLPSRNEIAIQYGGILYSVDLKGKLIEKSGTTYNGIVYNDLTLDSQSNQLIGCGQVGGGNGLYFYPLENNKWCKKKQELQGRIVEVEENLAKLYKQTLDFKLPNYQKKSEKPWVMITAESPKKDLGKLHGGEVQFVKQIRLEENSPRTELVNAIGEVALKRDKRKRYDMSQDDIVAIAKEHEAKGIPFTAWTGHGNDPFIVSLETMLKVLEVAPTTCYGFIYAEMHNVEDPRVPYFINNYVPALATAMRKNGRAKLYFRYKNMFWATSSHIEPWKQMFFSGEYADILVPASEDTSSRTQDINLAGRVGMYAGGYVNDFAMRLVDDNPTSWRPYTPGGQISASPYLRQGVMMASYGARMGILFKNNYLGDAGYSVLFALMKSGVLPIVEKDDILSIGSWHLIKDLDEGLIHKIDNHHNMKQFTTKDSDAVLSQAQMHWAGGSLPSHDFSKLALGVDYRWMNYMPVLPHGMVPIAPIEYAAKLKAQNTPFSVSNASNGYVDGKQVSAQAFGKELLATVEAGEERLPIVVEGAAWSAIRIDDTHIRIILMDQGYIDPQKRKASICIHKVNAKSAIDILSKKKLKIKSNKIDLTVPAGSFRFVDVEW